MKPLPRLSGVVLAAVFVVAGTPGRAQTRPSDLILELTNGFGVTKQVVPRSSIETAPEGLDYGACERAILALRMAPGVFVCVAAWDLVDASKTDSGTLRVTLKSGATLEGTSFGTLVSSDGKQRDSLGAIQKMRVVQLPNGYERFTTNSYDQADMVLSPTTWELSLGEHRFDIRRPNFWFSYYSTDGYVMGGSDRTGQTATVQLKKSGDELEAPIADFSEVTVRGNGISVKAPGGALTEGVLSLHATDSKGRHDARKWWFGGVLQGTSLTRVVMAEGQIALRRK